MRPDETCREIPWPRSLSGVKNAGPPLGAVAIGRMFLGRMCRGGTLLWTPRSRDAETDSAVTQHLRGRKPTFLFSPLLSLPQPPAPCVNHLPPSRAPPIARGSRTAMSRSIAPRLRCFGGRSPGPPGCTHGWRAQSVPRPTAGRGSRVARGVYHCNQYTVGRARADTTGHGVGALSGPTSLTALTSILHRDPR